MSNLSPAYLPDALKDSKRIRDRRVHRLLGDGRGLIPRLLIATEHAPLAWVTVPLGALDLYAKDTVAQAHAVGLALTGDSPAWNILQRGREGGVHLNIITIASPVPTRAGLPVGTYVQSVDDARGGLVGLATYLSGPNDQLAAQHRDPRTGRRYRPSPDDLRRAVASYVAARMRGRLPRLRWTTCVGWM